MTKNRGLSAEEIDEVFSDACRQFYAKYDRRESKPSTYIHFCVLGARDKAFRRKRRGPICADLKEAEAVLNDEQPEARAELADELAQLKRLMAGMDSRHRKAVILRSQGTPWAEIASCMGVTRSTALKRYQAGLRYLRRIMGRNGKNMSKKGTSQAKSTEEGALNSREGG